MILFILGAIGILASILAALITTIAVLILMLISKDKYSQKFYKAEIFKYLKFYTLVLLVSLVVCFGTSKLINSMTEIQDIVQEEVSNFDNLTIHDDVTIKPSDDNSFKLVKIITNTTYDEPLWKKIILFPLKDTSSISYTIYVPAELVK